MKSWLFLVLGVLICVGFVEPTTGLRRIIDMVTGNINPTPVDDDDIATDPVEPEDNKSENVDVAGDEEEDGDDEEDYSDRKKKPPHHHQPQEHEHHHPQQPPIPLPPPISLPAPPPLFKPKETVTATKTIYAEVTKRVTRHPVCMTVCGVKPPCLPAELHTGHHHDCIHKHCAHDNYQHDEVDKILPIEPTSTIRTSPTAAPILHQDNANSPSEDNLVDLESSREGRYIEFARNTPSLSSTPEAITEINNDTELGRHLQLHAPETHTVTSTMWVTTVQEVIDRRVTATLEVKNCVPNDLKIPICHSPPPHKPSVISHRPPRPPTSPLPILVALSPKPTVNHKPHKPSHKPPSYPVANPPHYEIIHGSHDPSLLEIGKKVENDNLYKVVEDDTNATEETTEELTSS